MKFEVQAKILEMRDGIPTKLVVDQLDGRVYVLEGNIEAIKKVTVKEEPKIGTVEEQLLKEVKPKVNSDLIDRVYSGKAVATVSAVTIKKPLLDEIKKRGLSGDYRKILKEIYPHFKDKSIVKYNWAYKKYLGDYIGSRGQPKKPKRKKQSTKRRRYTKSYKKANYNKKYGVIIKDGERELITDSIKKATLPTVNKLIWLTKLPSYRVRAIIDQLRNEDKIISRQLGTTTVYYPVKK